MELEWHGPHVGMEVEEAGLATAEPLRDVLGVAKRRAQRHNADVVADLAADVAHARADDLQHRLQRSDVSRAGTYTTCVSEWVLS